MNSVSDTIGLALGDSVIRAFVDEPGSVDAAGTGSQSDE